MRHHQNTTYIQLRTKFGYQKGLPLTHGSSAWSIVMLHELILGSHMGPFLMNEK